MHNEQMMPDQAKRSPSAVSCGIIPGWIALFPSPPVQVDSQDLSRLSLLLKLCLYSHRASPFWTCSNAIDLTILFSPFLVTTTQTANEGPQAAYSGLGPRAIPLLAYVLNLNALNRRGRYLFENALRVRTRPFVSLPVFTLLFLLIPCVLPGSLGPASVTRMRDCSCCSR